MFDFVEQLPEGILKRLFNIVAILVKTCTLIFEYAEMTLQDIIIATMVNFELPQIQIDAINAILSGPWAWIYHYPLIEILLGGALIAVVIFGIIKYFTDIVF